MCPDPQGEGLTFHRHGSAILGLLIGVKHWVVVPPGRLTSAMRTASYAGYDVLQQKCPPEALCTTQWPGDVMYVPEGECVETEQDVL